MIKLSGLTIKDKTNPKGDIEIKIIGLRSGEKLFEELIIDGQSKQTPNQLIFYVNEISTDSDFLFRELDKLDDALKNLNKEKALNILAALVPEWQKSYNS